MVDFGGGSLGNCSESFNSSRGGGREHSDRIGRELYGVGGNERGRTFGGRIGGGKSREPDQDAQIGGASVPKQEPRFMQLRARREARRGRKAIGQDLSLFRGNLGWGDTNAGMLTITRNPFETRRSPRFQVPFSGGTDFAGPFAREPRPDETDIFSRLYNRTAKAVRRVWDVDDPLGFDPDEIAAQRQLAARYPVLGPIQYFNEVIGYPATVFADSALRSVPAALHGGAALAGQSIDEFGASKTQGRQLERGIVNFGNYLGLRVAGAGGAGGAAVQGAAAAKIAHEAATARRFVSGPNGSINFGQVGSDIAAASAGRFPAAPIRIQLGRVGPTDFGVRHLTPDKHIRARNLGYSDGVALVQDVARSNDVAIGQVNGRLMLAQLEDVGRYAVF